MGERVAYAESVDLDEIVARGAAAAEALPSRIVYAGFSLGALPAQFRAQARPARGALLLHGGVPTAEFASPWSVGVPVQLHAMDGDEWVSAAPAADAGVPGVAQLARWGWSHWGSVSEQVVARAVGRRVVPIGDPVGRGGVGRAGRA